MKYIYQDASVPVEYVSSGELVSKGGFLHPKRNLDSFVLLMCKRGTLHIYSNGTYYNLKPNEYLILLPGALHFGSRESEGELTYDWTHFYIHANSYRLLDYSGMTGITNDWIAQSSNRYPDILLIPEYGIVGREKRAFTYFSQLLDVSKRNHYMPSSICHYSLSNLLIELTHDFLEDSMYSMNKYPPLIIDILEWIRTHADTQLQVQSIAAHFNYHPTYISNAFRKYTGQSLNQYIQLTKIALSKSLLENNQLSVQDVAVMTGYEDSKYFMKLFKRYEGVTPTEYRKSFHEKKIIL